MTTKKIKIFIFNDEYDTFDSMEESINKFMENKVIDRLDYDWSNGIIVVEYKEIH